MKPKLNCLMVLALLAALVGGTTSPVKAEEPVHYFTWNPAAPQEGVGDVYFTATPPAGIWSLKWDRSTNPGGTTCDQNFGGYSLTPSSEFFQSGDYLVCLTIYMSENDPNPIVDTQTVTLTNLPPVIGQTYSGARGGLVYYASASTYDQDYATLVTCTVDYGDGTPAVTGVLSPMSCTGPDHEYAAEGTYTVTIALNEQGFVPVTASFSLNVVNVPVQHAFAWSPASPAVGEDVTFSLTGGEPPPEVSLLWTRGSEPGGTECDATIGTEVAPVTSFAAAGDYKVCLAMFYLDEPWGTDSQVVTVVGAPPVLSNPTVTPAITVAGYPVTASVSLTDYDSGLTCTVDFGDGTDPVPGILNGSCTALHAYAAAGDYTVTFTVTGSGFDPVTATASHTVVPPYANAVFNFSGSVQNPEAALNAPDGLYASVRSDSTIVLDLGAPVQGALLTIYHSTRSPACTVLTYSTESEPYPIGVTAAGADRSLISLIAAMPPTQYIGIQCGTLGKKAVFQLDAIQVEPIAVPAGYATGAIPYGGDVQNPGAVVGAADGIYATIGEAGGAIMVDMGAPLQAILTIYHSANSAACTILWGGQYPLGTTLPGATSTGFIIPPLTNSPEFFAIQCTAGKGIFELDAAYTQSTIEELTGYAVATFASNSEYVQNPGAAVGAPDGTYATMAVSSSGGTSDILLDLGAPMQGMLTVYHSTKSPACMVFASLMLNDIAEPDVILGVTYSGTESTNLFMGEQNRYVWISCSSTAAFELDAIYADPSVTPTGYALTAFGGSGSAVENPDAAIGAPDGQYATMTQSGMILLELGAVQQGTLMVYLGQGGGSCQVQGATEYFGTLVPLEPLGWGSVARFSIPEGGVRYILINCTLLAGEVFELDAIHAIPVLEPTGYGLAVYYSSPDVQNPDAATGGPDGAYATITAAGGGLMLDMGGPMQGILTVYHSTTSPACLVYAFDTTTPEQQPMPVGMTTPGAEQSTIAITTDIQYILIGCETLPKRTVFELDAVQVEPGTVTPTGYAVGVMPSSDVQNPFEAIGEPDNTYATITASGGSIILDMGALVQGTLTVYHSSASPSCQVNMYADLNNLPSPIGNGNTTAGATSSVFTLTGQYRYVMVWCQTLGKRQVFQLDAVQGTLP